MLLVLGGRRRKGDGLVLSVYPIPLQGTYLAPALSGEDTERDNRTVRKRIGERMSVHCDKLGIGKDAVTGRGFGRQRHMFDGAAADILLPHRPSRQHTNNDERMILLRGGGTELGYSPRYLIAGDVPERRPAEAEVAVQEATVVSDRSGAVFSLTGCEEPRNDIRKRQSREIGSCRGSLPREGAWPPCGHPRAL